MTKTYDIAILGGGHNGLVTAFYLARAGLSVVVLEKNAVVGGAAVTEEFHPGFRNSVASYTVSLLNPKIIADLDLHRHGLKIVERPVANFWPIDASRGLVMPYGLANRQAAIAQFSKADAERLPAYDAALDRAANVLRDLVLKTPPNAGGGILELIKGAGIGRRVLGLSLDDQRLMIDLFTKSAASFLDGWFENTHVKAAFAFDGIVGAYASPYQPGTAYVLLHHCFGEVNGKPGVWGHAIGGMGAITQAMAAAARERGAEIRTDAPVAMVD
ncbi:MAG TPA: NAD(P)/FAD-dependent oxidoreductase, partial [Hyphomicrobiaceae bacterium]|nr:NAD(P)/FAD-dependent oxidoreductase [Hyphomicrobiaceae bacterium]